MSDTTPRHDDHPVDPTASFEPVTGAAPTTEQTEVVPELPAPEHTEFVPAAPAPAPVAPSAHEAQPQAQAQPQYQQQGKQHEEARDPSILADEADHGASALWLEAARMPTSCNRG